MDNYLLRDVVEFDPQQLGHKTWLVVHKLHRTPYHVGLIAGNMYYALTVSGPDIRPLEVVAQELNDKSYNNLVIEINYPGKIDNPEKFFQRALDHVQFTSCLFPIREYIAALTADNKFTGANNLFDLLDLLAGHNLTGIKMATRITPLMESKIVLMRYTQETIARHIKRLNELNERGKDKNNIIT